MTRGPVPKRSDQRRRRNATPATDRVDGKPVMIPETPEHWHPLAQQMFNGLRDSAQSSFYQQSDWAFALITCERMSLLLADDSPNASAWSDVNAALGRLMVTEGDRRRMRLEVQAAAPATEQRPATVRRLKAVDGGE